jgi:type IV secretory pathway VirB4 component
MNDPLELDCRKILVFDEAHDLIGKTAAGTIETAFRLYRKRKGIVIAASQSGEDFYVGAGGQAIVQNSAHKIFLRQDPSKFHLTAQAFNLTEQQASVILRLRTVKGIESQFFLISDIGRVQTMEMITNFSMMYLKKPRTISGKHWKDWCRSRQMELLHLT